MRHHGKPPVLFKNVHKDQTATFRMDGATYVVKPGEEIDVPYVYGSPRVAVNGSALPSVVEGLAPQLKPQEMVEPAAPSPPVVKASEPEHAVIRGRAPGVAALLAEKDKAKKGGKGGGSEE